MFQRLPSQSCFSLQPCFLFMMESVIMSYIRLYMMMYIIPQLGEAVDKLHISANIPYELWPTTGSIISVSKQHWVIYAGQMLDSVRWVILASGFSGAGVRPIKTLNVRGPSYLGLTTSTSWLLMPWLLTSPGHQQPWYWLYRICRSLSYLRKNFKYLCHNNMEERHKM